jgi:hypothetical protein
MECHPKRLKPRKKRRETNCLWFDTCLWLFRIKAFRINREMKLCEMRACVFELGKIMLRFGVPKDIRRMITKLAFTTIIE